MTEDFERYLRERNLSGNTISSYLFAVRQFQEQHNTIDQKNLRVYKNWLIEKYDPRTVNLRLRAINCYPESIHQENYQQQTHEAHTAKLCPSAEDRPRCGLLRTLSTTGTAAPPGKWPSAADRRNN